jgi:hypothetical protein
MPVSLICPSYVLPQYYLCLRFVNSESCFNAVCASDWPIMCPIPIRMCLWFVHSVSCLCGIGKRHRMDNSKTEEVLRQDTEWTNQRHRKHWDKTQNGQTRDTDSIGTRPSYVLSQYYPCLWFINSESCFNAACASDQSIMCPIPIPHVSLTQAVLREDTTGTSQRHMRYWDRTHNGLIRGTCSIETRLRIDKPETRVSGLSLLCLLSILPVSLVCSFSVLFQSCLCLGDA